MSTAETRLIPTWLWSGAVIALGAVIGLLVAGDRRTEPSEVFRYDIAAYQQVDPALVLFKETGSLTPGLERLSALATTPDERIYVAGDKTMVVYNLDGAEVRRFPLSGTPECVAVAPDGDILLGMRSHVEVLDGQGVSKAVWPHLGDRAYLTSIAVNEDAVYVADAGQRAVLRFDRAGKLLTRIGEEDAAREIPGFVVPSPYFDVAFDTQGALWAVNPGRHGLENYRPNGDLVSSWYRPSIKLEGFAGCCNPSHIAFRSDGALVTTEKGLARVKLYAPDWKLLGVVAPPKAFDDALAGAFSCDLETPLHDLAVDARDRVLVLDTKRRAVRIFEETELAEWSKNA